MADASSSRSLLCRCGAGICPILTSKTDKTGRRYYCCPAANREQQCGFFKWLDQVRAHELIDVPLCACGAGICRLDVKTTGPSAGRNFFVCPIKKGQGACNYFMWLDAHANAASSSLVHGSLVSPQSTPTNCGDVIPANSNPVEESGPSNLGQAIESLLFHTSQSSKNLVPATGPLKRDKVMQEGLKGSKDTLHDPLRKHCKRLRHGDSKRDGSPSGSPSMHLTIPPSNSRDHLTEEDGQASSPAIELEIHHHHRPRDFWRQNFVEDITLAASENFLSVYHHSSVHPIDSEVVRETSWIVAAIHQNLSSQIQGWWGRLAFPPSKCLIERALEPFFCCVFPSFDPIFVPPNVDLLNGRSLATTRGSPLTSENSRQSSLTLHGGARPLGTQESSIMRDVVSKTFVKAAEQLQKDLLTRLRSLNIRDHEIMIREANAIFDALDQLQIDHKIFSGQVKEFINSASLLDIIDRSMKSDRSFRMLADRFHYEKLKLDEINDAYARGIDAFSVSKQRAALLTEEVSHLKDKLFQTEAELSRCDAESTALKARMVEMLKDKENFEQSLQSTFKKLEKARKLHQLREAEQHAAKAAFEKAKILLWG